MSHKALIVLLLLSWCTPLWAQAIRGEVIDMDDKSPIEGVSIENIYTSLDVSTSLTGSFLIAATGDQLLEFKKNGYKTTRVRIPRGYVPPYFRIIMKRGLPEIDRNAIADRTNRYDYRSDSLRLREIYKQELDFPKMSTIDKIAHPFTAMSSRNREKWQFQDDFAQSEKEKYVDMTFNAELITKITGLKGDSLTRYMRRYRPAYAQLRTMNDYTFFSYIKSTVQYFRSPNMPRSSQ